MISPARNTVTPWTMSYPTGRTLCAVRTPFKMRTDFSSALKTVESSPSTAAVSSTYVCTENSGGREAQGGEATKKQEHTGQVRKAPRTGVSPPVQATRLSGENRVLYTRRLDTKWTRSIPTTVVEFGVQKQRCAVGVSYAAHTGVKAHMQEYQWPPQYAP